MDGGDEYLACEGGDYRLSLRNDRLILRVCLTFVREVTIIMKYVVIINKVTNIDSTQNIIYSIN